MISYIRLWLNCQQHASKAEVLDYLAENAPPGTFRFEIGVQSTNDPNNELVKRRQNLWKLSRTCEQSKAICKIVQHLYHIAGLPEKITI